MRCYRVSRISSMVATEKGFHREPGFDIREWWPRHSQSFAQEFSAYRCVLCVPESELRLLHRMAPGRARVLRKGEWMDVELGVESEWYALLIVVGLGSKCRIVSPKELVASVARRLQEVQGAINGSGVQ
jgi:predicted DNA-binding transcriptional regulator YafY